MDNEQKIDFAPFVGKTRFTHAKGIVLAIQLLTLAPALAVEHLRIALFKLRAAALNAQAIAVAQLRLTPETLKPVDTRLDSAIVGLRMALEAKARLLGTDIGDRAARLLVLVFPNGTGFVQFTYEEQWAAVQALLERIVLDGLDTEIDAIAGPEFVPYIRAAHEEMGEGLGLGETGLTAPDSAVIQSSNRALAKAIAGYSRALVGLVDEDDPESVAMFKRAMYPLEAHRRSMTSGATAPSEEEPSVDDVEPTDPIPPLPEPSEPSVPSLDPSEDPGLVE